MSSLEWHPMFVHFPLALAIGGASCLVGAQLAKAHPLRVSLLAAGNWNLILGGASGLLTLATGLGAIYHTRLSGGAQHSVSTHMIWAVCSSQFLIVLALWRAMGARDDRAPGWLFLTLLGIDCLGLIVTGYYGGENVYHYALGVSLH